MVNIGSVYIWICAALIFLVLDILLSIFIVLIVKKTHALMELKAWRSGKPIALFFRENRYCEWKAVDTVDGIVQDKKYGAYIINERATYVDKTTKNILLPFDASYNPDMKVTTGEIVDDFHYLVKDEEEMKKLRIAIVEKNIVESDTIKLLTTTIHMGAIKNMTTALVPHNIIQKIEKIISKRVNSYGSVDVKDILMVFGATFGIIVIGAILMNTIGG